MPRKYRKKGYARPRNKSTPVHKLLTVDNADWKTEGNQIAYTTQLVYRNNTGDGVSSSGDPGTSRCVSHIGIDSIQWPTIVDNIGGNYIEYAPGGGWILVYVPHGTAPSAPFDNQPASSDPYLYEPQQNVLGYGTWIGGQELSVPQGTPLDVTVTHPAGNNIRVRGRLSKRLQPGDEIYCVFYVLLRNTSQTATIQRTNLLLNYMTRV